MSNNKLTITNFIISLVTEYPTNTGDDIEGDFYSP